MKLFVAAIGLLIVAVSPNASADPQHDIVQRGCAALKSRVDTVASGPEFLRSYDNASGGEPDSSALKTAAFVYDDSLAVIALIACGDVPRASRVGEALRLATQNDTRLRNTYRAVRVDGKPLPNGWWDAAALRWAEDREQNGTSTGNVAWTALAMLALFESDHDKKWSAAAAKLARWIVENAQDSRPGFTGGIDGFDDSPTRVTWKSTEHNIDAVALFRRLSDDDVPGHWQHAESSARQFIDIQWDAASGHFFIGTLPDGMTSNRTSSALDAQVWPLLLRDAQKDWQRSLAYIEREHAVRGGFDFNTDRDGVWIEGTAQAALAYRVVGRPQNATPLFATIDAQFSTSGMVYATREPRVSTGLSTRPGGDTDDFYYFHVPHLGATAWAILAAMGRNPYQK
ncbi:MAG TPA: hypothetical protein VH082_05705 [Rudaea sp.]|nr:hypothetical protein [Rudaea sp.]